MCPTRSPRNGPQPHGSERRWTTLTEEQLLDTEFATDDPSALPGVVQDLPETDEVPYVEFAYSVGARQVRCVYDGYDNHGKGVVMRYNDGTRILVGWKCARKIWDVNFDLVAKDFDLAQKEAHYLRRRNAARAGAPRFLAALASLRKDPAIGRFQQLKSQFRSTLSSVAPLLDDLINRGGGLLFANDKVRDYEAEARRVVKEDEREAPMLRSARRYLNDMRIEKEPKKQLEPIYKTVRRPLGAISGHDFFLGGTEPIGVRLIHFEQRAVAVVEALQGPHERNTTVLKKRVMGLIDIVDGILGEIDRLESLNRAFEAGNLSRLVDWANSVVKDGTRYRQGHNGIIAEPERADPIVLSFPADYRVPSREPFKTFRAAITG